MCIAARWRRLVFECVCACWREGGSLAPGWSTVGAWGLLSVLLYHGESEFILSHSC